MFMQGLADTIPGGLGQQPPQAGAFPGFSAQQSQSSSQASTQTSALTATQAFNPTITIAGGGIGSGVSSENAPYLLGLGGLALFGGLLYMAFKRRAA